MRMGSSRESRHLERFPVAPDGAPVARFYIQAHRRNGATSKGSFANVERVSVVCVRALASHAENCLLGVQSLFPAPPRMPQPSAAHKSRGHKTHQGLGTRSRH